MLETCCLEQALSVFRKRHELIITERVRQEYTSGVRSVDKIVLVDNIFVVRYVQANEQLLPYFHFHSASGEISVISCAMQNPDATCVIDEQFARNICELFKIRLTGSIGIVKLMREEDILDRKDVRLVKDRLRNSSFYITDELLSQL